MLKRIFLLMCVVISICMLTACGDDETAQKKIVRPVKIINVKETKAEITRNFPGKVLASEEAVLSFLVPGQLIKLPIREGQNVTKKQFLAQLEDLKYREAYNEAKAKFIRSEAHYRRASELIKGRFISEADYDNRRSEYLSAKAQMNSAKKDLDDTILHAPFDGVISVKYVDNFEHVKAKQPIFKLQDLSHIDIEINVPENVMINLRGEADRSATLDVIFDAAPNKIYKAQFKEYSAEADPETQTYRVILIMPEPKDISILPGMTATIRTQLPDFKSGGKSYIQIPSGAVLSKNNKTYVWLVEPNMTVKQKEVTVSRMANNEIHVVSGLKPGDRIVGAGVHYLQEGQKISELKAGDVKR